MGEPKFGGKLKLCGILGEELKFEGTEVLGEMGFLGGVVEIWGKLKFAVTEIWGKILGELKFWGN